MPRKHIPPSRVPGIPRSVFRKIIEEIAAARRSDTRFQKEAVAALHEEAETYLTEHFQKSAELLRVCKTCTLRPGLFLASGASAAV